MTVRAAGGIIRRDGEVLVIHRPKYDDWSFPKGKLDEGETWEDAALREVEEETGFRCSLGPELGSTGYTDSRGRPKIARYWSMRPEEGEFQPTDEVDEIAWLSPADAAERLTYDRDRVLLQSLEP